MARPDRHNEIELNWLSSGSLTYLLGGRRITIHAGALAIFWAAIPHQIVDFERHVPYFVVTVPLTEFMRAGMEPNFVNRALQGELLIETAIDEGEGARFAVWEQELKSQSPILERATQLEVRSRLLRMSHRITPGAHTKPAPILSRADQLACYIARNYRMPLTSESIAKAVGLNPNYAMNLFRKAFGTTMTAFTVQHRLSHAQRLLVTTDDSILHIAIDSGFQSLSRFNEVFKEACACSPRDYRKSYR